MERNKETRKCLKVNILRAYALEICAEREREKFQKLFFCTKAPAHMTQET